MLNYCRALGTHFHRKLLFYLSFSKGKVDSCTGAENAKVRKGKLVTSAYKEKVRLNSLPDDRTLDWSKLKQIADKLLACHKNEK